MSDHIIGSGFGTVIVRGNFTLAILPLQDGRPRVSAKPSVLRCLSIHPDRVKDRLQILEFEELQEEDQVALYTPMLRRLVVEGAVRTVLKDWAFDTLQMEYRSAGPLVATGTCNRLNLRFDSPAPADLSRLKIQNATIAVDGAGSVSADVRHRLMADINGMGDLVISERPQQGVTHRRNRKGGDLFFRSPGI